MDSRRGRPRTADLDAAVLTATVELLNAHGYDNLRMKDVASRAGVGLGAIYRRWPGKTQLLTAALGADVGKSVPSDTQDPVADLLAAASRVCAATNQGLDKLVAACLAQPDSELARVAVAAKLVPLSAALTRYLERIPGIDTDLPARAELIPAYILWHSAVHGCPPTEHDLRHVLLPLIGVPGIS